eukprot:CAMPEP_0173246414 /NCGR_PEP_ID=MMETSP1142-20121109/17305_1 /TAXON_ID=483371 /ORGANISM="non described non described, Strain CCMP2298" /LENGTH=61 /DNA_ID=CAMNT_0014178637 /DNA_START=27 /DNA_END=212 /DNA_ORIENTATION=-
MAQGRPQKQRHLAEEGVTTCQHPHPCWLTFFYINPSQLGIADRELGTGYRVHRDYKEQGAG